MQKKKEGREIVLVEAIPFRYSKIMREFTSSSLHGESAVKKNEQERLLELADIDLDYSEAQESMKALVKLAAKVAGTSISLINLIDSYTQWTISSFGISFEQMCREDSVCQYTIAQNDPFEILDLSQDDRFKDKFYVSGEPELRYYYGIPLRTPHGNNIGALCVLDGSARAIAPEKVELLKIIANEIVDRLMLRKTIALLSSKVNSVEESYKRVAHDIRGPLGGIISLSELITQSGQSGNLNEVLALIDLIHKSSKGLLELADEILSQNEKMKDLENQQSWTLRLFKEKLEKLFNPQALAKKVHFQVLLHNGQQGISVPKNKLLQIVGNLISNAIKFTPEQGDVTVDLNHFVKDERDFLEITVTDTGVGMDGLQILEILHGQGDSQEGTSGEKGYGFGLKLVQHLISRLSGTLTIESTIGEGSCLKVLLPQ